MKPFELVQPETLDEALALLADDDPSVRAIAGGTGLMLMMKTGVFHPTRLVSLRGIEKGHSAIAPQSDGSLRIGAMASLTAIERSEDVKRHAPVVTQTLRTLSNIRVRNVAMLGGHLAHADPHLDLPPVLVALSAQATIVSRSGTRTIAVQDLHRGYYETVIEPGELLTEIMIPSQAGRRSAYMKCTTRAAHDWPTLGVAVSLRTDGKSIREGAVVISAATEKPTRLEAAEAALKDAEAGDATWRRVAEAAAEHADVNSDTRGSAAYKRQLVRVYVERALRSALASASDQGTAH